MKKHLFFAMLFLIIITAITFPLVLNMTKYFPGFFSTDEPFAALWDSWRIKFSLASGISLRNTNLIAYPFGMDLYASGYFPYLWIGLIYLLSLFSTPILAYNFQALTNIFLSGVFTYFLVFTLTENRLSALLSGIIFAFCPYQFVRIWQHLGLSYNQWMPLVLLFAILLKIKPSRKNSLFFLLGISLLFSFDFSIMYLTAVLLLIFMVYSFFYGWRKKFFAEKYVLREDLRYILQIIMFLIIASVIFFPQFYPIIKKMFISSATMASAHNPYHRAFEDLFAQSAKPLSYFLPAVVHPIFGKFTEQFVGSSLYGISFTEHTLYLGWVPLVLAFVAIRRWRKMRKVGTVPFRDSPYYKENFYIGFFMLLAITAWLFSQPPWWNIFGFKIYMPSFFMYKILPMFRAYCRFGIVLMLAIAVLAGFGLKSILEKFESQKTKIVLTCLFSGLVIFEFWNWPPYKVIDVSKVPAVYYWLKEQPGDLAIAEYPLDSDSPNEMYKFYQTKHEKKIINCTIPGTYANKVAQTIKKLSDPKTAGRLKGMGVRYALVHREDYLNTELIEEIEELNRIPHNPGLKLIGNFFSQECPRKDIMCVQKTGPIDVYEVEAQPIVPEIKESGS